MIPKESVYIGVLLSIVLVLLSIMLFLDNQQLFMSLIEMYGYMGLFVVTFLGSATIFFVLPTDIFVFASAAFLNPFWIGIVGGLGKALGETVGYVLGLGSRKIIDRKYKKEAKKWEKMFRIHGGFFIIILFALTPLPDDIVGIVAGTLKYPFKKFLLASIIGKVTLTLILAYAGFYGIPGVLSLLSSFT